MALRFLIIRRDNIGDLVCTTPMLRALRERFPDAEIHALVNSYNRPVLENNPDVDGIHAYTKVKHRPAGKTAAAVLIDRARLVMNLRRLKFDYVILAAPRFQPRSLQLARLLKPQHIIGYTEAGRRGAASIDMPVPYALPTPMHEVDDVFRLLAPLGVEAALPPLRVFPDPGEAKRLREALAARNWPSPPTLVGLHISARKPSQRWPAQRFVELARRLHREYRAAFMLFWSPGDNSNPLHPGDDAKAGEIVTALEGVPVLPCPSVELKQLIAGLSLCERVVCSDGGAMHIAAAAGKPILCFFGQSEATRWHPWGVPYVLLQSPGREVGDITVEQAFEAFRDLLAKSESGRCGAPEARP
ncbi:MAG: glycosyltransferase family 9 protein [Betaproteobacteria bacterium]|nr:glycosyltransferase family 9 protein [Betaproteobacteria bacterium]